MKRPATIYYARFDGPNPRFLGCRAAESTEEVGLRDSSEPVSEPSEEPHAPGRLMSETYSWKEVSRLFSISEGRLRYWDRSGFLSPSGRSGRKRCYTFQDLVGIRSAKTLLEKGVSLQKARHIVGILREKMPLSTRPLDRLRILSDSKTVIVVDDDREFEADSGQMLLDFRVGEFEKDIVSELPRYLTQGKERTAYEWYLEGCQLDENEDTLSQAEEAYHRAIHLDPTLANAYTNLGNLLYRSGSNQDAKTLYQKAIEVDPAQAEAHYNLGFLEFEEGALDDAEARFTRAVELDSTFADAHFNVAITLYRLGKLELARHHLQLYLSIEPTGPWADIARKRLRDLS
ncbi:MAG: tetratricopeptide repeat protein [Proteobacteria bacterium]|nr:tetratricopeptide repeat protein [Pseudomonadota bacterium]